jgi:hypothetical protein
MKPSLIASAAAALACVCLASCDRDKSPAKSSASSTPPPASEVVIEPRPPIAPRVTAPEDFKVAEEEPGTPEVIVVEPPAPTPGQRLDHAIEKTQDGVRRAAEATGRGLQRAGDAIERKADEKSR